MTHKGWHVVKPQHNNNKYAWAELHFQWLIDPEWNENIICFIVEYGETFYGRHTALNTRFSEVKWNKINQA